MATNYTILRSEPEANSYSPVGTQDAGNGDAAITAFLNEEDKDGVMRGEKLGEGDYRAVASRSWEEKPKAIRKRVSFG